MAAVSACSQESLLFPTKPWSLMPSVIFAKQKSLKPGRKGLTFTSSTRSRCLRGKGGETLDLLQEKRAGTLGQSCSGCVLGMHGCAGVPELPAGPGQAAASGGEPRLDLEGQLVQGVLVHDKGLVQQVLGDLGWGNTEGTVCMVADTEISRAFLPFQHVLGTELTPCCFLEKPNLCWECCWHKDAAL